MRSTGRPSQTRFLPGAVAPPPPGRAGLSLGGLAHTLMGLRARLARRLSAPLASEVVRHAGGPPAWADFAPEPAAVPRDVARRFWMETVAHPMVPAAPAEAEPNHYAEAAWIRPMPAAPAPSPEWDAAPGMPVPAEPAPTHTLPADVRYTRTPDRILRERRARERQVEEEAHAEAHALLQAAAVRAREIEAEARAQAQAEATSLIAAAREEAERLTERSVAEAEAATPPWRKPFVAPPNVRFTRTPDRLLTRRPTTPEMPDPAVAEAFLPAVVAAPAAETALTVEPAPTCAPQPTVETAPANLAAAVAAGFVAVPLDITHLRLLSRRPIYHLERLLNPAWPQAAAPGQDNAGPHSVASAPMPLAARPVPRPVMPPPPPVAPRTLPPVAVRVPAPVPLPPARPAAPVPAMAAPPPPVALSIAPPLPVVAPSPAPASAPWEEEVDELPGVLFDPTAAFAPMPLAAAQEEDFEDEADFEEDAEDEADAGTMPLADAVDLEDEGAFEDEADAADLMPAAFAPEPAQTFAMEEAPQFREPVRLPHHDPEDGYALPYLEYLATPRESDLPVESQETLADNAVTLQQILQDFGVRGEIIAVRPGPVVTLYELEPAPGTKSSRVIALADDIARSMSAISARVAVVAGRNAIGIELPNARRETVYLRALIAVPDFGETRHKLALCLGKTIGGEPVIADLARMPHLLVAGTTGSGKSVAINTMILSLLYRLRPEECRLIMVDPKMLELSVYDGIPHLLSPVVTDPKKAVIALKWAVREMEERYKKMSKVGVRNIDGFNARVAEAAARGEVLTRTVQTGFDRHTGEAVYEDEVMDLVALPYIVIIVDEMADLMMVAGKDIEGAIQRLAQMARAAGIHLIMATQRPSVDVITGTIKANFPTRISFQVTSKIDSRTILGEMGAEQLLGQGDMLFMAGGGRTTRVHGPFCSDAEVEQVVAHLKRQGRPAYLEAVTADDGSEDEGKDGKAKGEGKGEGKADKALPAGVEAPVFDRTAQGALGTSGGLPGSLEEEGEGDVYAQAVAVVLRDRKASTSYIQRRLQIGYNRAASLMERMETEGIVGPANHAGKREILIEEGEVEDAY